MSKNNNNSIPVVQAELVPDNANANANTNANYYPATPNEYFEYNEETLRNESQSGPIPSAPTLNTIEDNSPHAQTIDETRRARYGTVIGKIQADRERESIREHTAKAKSQPYIEKNRISVANQIAQQRKRQVNITEDKYFDESGLLCARNGGMSNNKKGNKSSTGEYQVSDYNVEEYDVANYETTAYKSVYD